MGTSLPESPLGPGSRFGDYEILAELGAGGMGRVYRARDLTLERVVALKTLAPQLGGDPAFVQRFLKEARAAARLNHPNIVQIYSFGQVAGTYYLAMEYVDGRSLGAFLRSGPLAELDAISVVRHACRALAVAHAEGLVHRDIKPDNLMLTRRGEVKLVDLGIAKRVDEDQSLTQTGHAVGTPHYISPEQISGSRDIDGRADIYSLGATLYHLVTGHTPFKGPSGAVVMTMHLTQPLPDPRTHVPGLSEGLCRVVRKSMAKRREERYADVDALDRDLYRVQVGEPPEADEPGETAVETSTSPPHPTTATSQGQATTGALAFAEAQLRLLETELARQVGPLARVLVKKAARVAGTSAELVAALELEIPSEEGRRAFRSAVARLH
ncbi:MAG TPA: serine/threonine-protein kinase [Vicinamibacteria bacterium]|nr:serine/threonine-protein kinase [Vicinamibacteria bacterium]